MRLPWLPWLLAGCGAQIANGTDASSGGSQGGKGDNPQLTPSTFLTKLGDSECDEAFSCRASFPSGGSQHFEDEWGSSTDECYAGVADYFMPGDVEADVAIGRIVFDAAAARTCLQNIDYGSCSQFWQHGPQYPSACSTALQGTLQQGDACTNDFECAGENVCDPDSQECSPPARREPTHLALPQSAMG